MRFSEAIDSMRNRASGGNSLSSVSYAARASLRHIGLARLIIKNRNLTRIVGHREVVQPIAIEVSGAKVPDKIVNREGLRPRESEQVCLRFGCTGEGRTRTPPPAP